MVRAAIVFFVIGLVALFLGMYGFAGFSLKVGRLLLAVFLILGVLSAVAGLISTRRPPSPPPL